MKKIFALLLCFVMLFAFAGCGEVSEGDVVKVPVELVKNPGMAAAQLIIEYDTDKLTFLGYNNGTLFESCKVVETGGKISAVLVKDFSVSMDDVTAKGTLLELKLQVKKGAGKGTVKFKVSESQFVNTNEQYVKATVEVANIKIK